MWKLQQIINRCKASVSLEVNPNRDYYQSIEEYIEYLEFGGPVDIDDYTKQEMIKRDTFIALQFYPDTPIGFYVVHGYDLDQVIEEAYQIIQEECSDV